jgi:hypothetical protein
MRFPNKRLPTTVENSRRLLSPDRKRCGLKLIASPEPQALLKQCSLTDLRCWTALKALGEFNSVSSDVPDAKTHQYAIALTQFELADYRAAIETLTPTEQRNLSQESANLLAVSYSKLGLYQESYAVQFIEILRIVLPI